MQDGKILNSLYHNLRRGYYDPNMLLHHSDVYYVRAALMAKAWVLLSGNSPKIVQDEVSKMSLETLGNILREEGLLKYHEYGIPRWYARKWLNEGLSKRQAVKFARSVQRRYV